jgi:hypothetical protein
LYSVDRGSRRNTATAVAQEYPAKAIRIVVPYSPGGGLDVVGRPIAQKLSESYGQPVVIDNRPGGGTTIGTTVVAKATADGYTLLLTLSALTISPSLYPNLPYDPVTDFFSRHLDRNDVVSTFRAPVGSRKQCQTTHRALQIHAGQIQLLVSWKRH